MRTTLDLPASLMQAAKMRAVQRNEPLKELFARALAHEVGTVSTAGGGGRIALPLIGRGDGPETVELTNADIEAAFEAEDIERHAS